MNILGKKSRALAALAMAAAAAGPLGTTAALASDPSISISPSVIPDQGTATITGRGCGAPRATVYVTRKSAEPQIGKYYAPPVDAQGDWTMEFKQDLLAGIGGPPGYFTVRFACDDYDSFFDGEAHVTVLPPPGDPDLDGALEVSAATVRAGESLTVTSDGWGTFWDVSLFLLSDPILIDNQVPAGEVPDKVSVTHHVTIPVDTTPGEHLLVAYGDGVGSDFPRVRVLGATITVLPAAVPQPGIEVVDPSTLPRTGSDHAAPLALAAGALLLVGVAALAAARRRGTRWAEHLLR